LGKAYKSFLPFLLTYSSSFCLKFFGLVPFSATFTSNIAVTATLAIIAFLMIQLGGIRHNGFFGYFKGLVPHGIPMWLLPLMIPVKYLDYLQNHLRWRYDFCKYDRRPYSDSCTHWIDIFYGYNFHCTGFSCFAFYLSLEILVALIQAYIFTMLTSLFIGMAVHQEH